MHSANAECASHVGATGAEAAKPSPAQLVLHHVRRAMTLALVNPRGFIAVALAALRGTWYAGMYRLARRNVRIHLPFFAYERVQIQGNGCVEIDSWCSVFPNVFVGLRIVTLSPEAEVRIGREASLGGLTIRCRSRIVLGARVQTAYSLIQDDWFVHSEAVENRHRKAPRVRAIHVTDHTWLAMNVCVLGGSRVGRGTVISAGSVLSGRVVPDGHLGAGNPIRVSMPIRQLVRLRG